MKHINRLIALIAIFNLMGCSDKINTKLVNEKYRPQLHFSPESKWMNDPNGMVYYEGEYHLFYQYFFSRIKP